VAVFKVQMDEEQSFSDPSEEEEEEEETRQQREELDIYERRTLAWRREWPGQQFRLPLTQSHRIGQCNAPWSTTWNPSQDAESCRATWIPVVHASVRVRPHEEAPWRTLTGDGAIAYGKSRRLEKLWLVHLLGAPLELTRPICTSLYAPFIVNTKWKPVEWSIHEVTIACLLLYHRAGDLREMFVGSQVFWILYDEKESRTRNDFNFDRKFYYFAWAQGDLEHRRPILQTQYNWTLYEYLLFLEIFEPLPCEIGGAC
jgi:hypothetical protein